jgi:hypothetical protein
MRFDALVQAMTPLPFDAETANHAASICLDLNSRRPSIAPPTHPGRGQSPSPWPNARQSQHARALAHARSGGRGLVPTRQPGTAPDGNRRGAIHTGHLGRGERPTPQARLCCSSTSS